MPELNQPVPNVEKRTCRLLRLWCLCLGLAACLVLGGCGTKHTDSGPPAAARGVVKTAYSQIGKKYVPGGTSPRKGFDCSGLLWWAYRQHGIEIPRLTVDQAKIGKAVPLSKPRPGDIVVFRTSRSPRGLHTGIYAGDDSFIHSPRRGERVRMESIAEPYWKGKLIAVRRVTG
ncbi:MAG: C40 family peptidase [Desulfovibrio sp.]|jgi:cell wall-associated NlpC family hydrolase|nr:C40 family peptidase [Desulfovibrio sp.]